MIRELGSNDNSLLMEYLKQDSITNYFIILSLEMSKYEEKFDKKWGEFDDNGKLRGVLFRRKTGNMQFYSKEQYDAMGFSELLNKENFIKLIAVRSVAKELENFIVFSKIEESSFISKLDKTSKISNDCDKDFKPVEIKDLDKIIDLYRLCFKSFAPREAMIDKYSMRTGRGYFLESDEKIVCVVQSAYEDDESAIIVGVATHPDYRNLGLATRGLVKLLGELLSEGKDVYLQYENPRAGDIYKKLGFKDTGRMMQYYK